MCMCGVGAKLSGFKILELADDIQFRLLIIELAFGRCKTLPTIQTEVMCISRSTKLLNQLCHSQL